MTPFQIQIFNYLLEENRIISLDELFQRFVRRDGNNVLYDINTLVELEFVDEEGYGYIISDKGKEFDRQHNEKINRVNEKENLEIKNLRNQVLDYETKLNDERTMKRIAIIVAIIEAVGLLLLIL